jgi:hypothetical protein
MRRFVTLLTVTCLSACRAGSSAPDGRDFPHATEAIDRSPSMDDITSLTFSGTDAGTVTLTDGVWRGASAGDAGGAELRLVRDFRLTGDITGNGREEAVVLLEYRNPPAEPKTYVAIVASLGAQLANIATAEVTDPIEVRGGRVELGRLTLEGRPRAPAGAAAEPAGTVSLTYQLDRGSLRLTSRDPAR